MAERAVFLDRDGTINVDVEYLAEPDEVELLPGAAGAISRLSDAGLRLIVVTNQSGIARGLINEERIPEIHARLDSLLAEHGARVDGYYYCPHHPEHGNKAACGCRKPETGMALRAAAEHGLDLVRSYFVGDKLSDVMLGRNAGGKTVLVLTGQGMTERERLKQEGVVPDRIADGLSEAADWIIQDLRESS